jgi:phage FluMu protein Com
MYRMRIQSGPEVIEFIETTIPHSSFGAPECDGRLNGIIADDGLALIECNECGAVIARAVPASDLKTILVDMELSLDLASILCPHCRSVNLFAAFSRMPAFICKAWGQAVTFER